MNVINALSRNGSRYSHSAASQMTIEKTHDELVTVILWIDERSHEVDIAGDDRSLIAAACFDLVLEHQNAVVRLVENKLCGSALAMLLVLAEAHIRGLWFARCATEEAAACFRASDSIQGGVPAMVKDIEASLGNATDTLSKLLRDQWGPLCGFTHTGFLQITRRYSDTLLKPNYPDHEVIQGMRFAGAMGLLAAIELAVLSKNESLALEIFERARQFAVH